MALPYLIYFTQKAAPRYPAGTTKLDIEKDLLTKALEYHYSYGVNGFLSERSTLEGIFKNLPRRVELEWDRFNMTDLYEVRMLATTAETEAEDKRKQEEALGEQFGRWVTAEALLK